ncbi:structural cement protein Gp24 [Anaerosolibacter sp.]|uniref:structural cement protein Gp24 n=1 Tax=Anaerosolibacter sp. TaxID=1872527 RepID=UPI0039EE9A50
MQTVYSQTQKVAVAGHLADLSDKRVDSYAAEGVIGLGIGVVFGTDKQNQVKVPTATTDLFAGVSMFQAKEQSLAGVIQYTDKDTVPVLNKGRIWVNVKGAVNAESDAVYLICTGADAGKFTATSTSNKQIANAKFKKSTAGDGITILQID